MEEIRNIGSYETAVDNYKKFGYYANATRALASDVDGLKVSYRRMLWTALHHPKDKFVKSAVISGECFTGDTKVPLLNGEVLTMEELTSRYGDNEFYVYSVDEHGNMVPGRAHSARMTRRGAELVKVTLDNGKSVTCTPDHLFMLRDGSYRKAIDLSEGESLMPLYRKSNSNKEYFKLDKFREIVYLNGSSQWVPTHLRVSEVLEGHRSDDEVVHHIDHDPFNNSPENLVRMTKTDHNKYHSRYFFSNMTEIDKEKFKEKISQGVIKWWKRIPKAERSARMKRIKKVYYSDSSYRSCVAKNISEGLRRSRDLNKDYYKSADRARAIKGWITRKSNESYQHHVDYWREKFSSNRQYYEVQKILKNLNKLLSYLDIVPSKSEYEGKRLQFMKEFSIRLPRLSTALKYFDDDYDKMIDQAKHYNHKVVRVEKLPYTQDVYDFAVDKYHNFAIDSGIIVHNCMKLHPHGEQSGVLYSLVNSKLQMFDKQGNFGSALIAGSAPRYTECRVNKMAELYLGQDLINYCEMIEGDIGYMEPKYLTALIPFILVDGNSSMGIGISSSIPSLDLLDLAKFYRSGLVDDNYNIMKLDLGNCRVLESEASVSSMIIKGKLSGVRYAINPLVDGNSIVITELPPGMSFSKVYKIFDEFIEKEQVDYRDESNSVMRHVFDIVKGDISEYLDKIMKLTSTESYDIVTTGSGGNEGNITYTSMTTMRNKTLSYLRECAIRKFDSEITKLSRKLNIYKVIKYMKDHDIVKDLTKLTIADIKKLLPFDSSDVDNALQQSISRLMKGVSSDEIDTLEKQLHELNRHKDNPDIYLIGLYNDFIDALNKHYKNMTSYESTGSEGYEIEVTNNVLSINKGSRQQDKEYAILLYPTGYIKVIKMNKMYRQSVEGYVGFTLFNQSDNLIVGVDNGGYATVFNGEKLVEMGEGYVISTKKADYIGVVGEYTELEDGGKFKSDDFTYPRKASPWDIRSRFDSRVKYNDKNFVRF